MTTKDDRIAEVAQRTIAFQEWMLNNPVDALEMMQATESADSLMEFVKLTWPVLEPGRKFISGWVIDAIAEHLEAVTAGQIRRLCINVPPGFTKSMLTNVFYPAWEWGPAGKPDMRYVGAAYSEALTVRDNFRCRNVIQSDLYQRWWGDVFQLAGDQNAKVKFANDKTGFKIATSVGGMATGERGDRFIIDDPHNVKDGESTAKREEALRFFSETVPTRLNDPDKSAIIVIMQRVHERDVSGLILKSELGYDHLCVPMEYEADHPHPSRTTLHFVDPRTEDGELAWEERFSKRHLEEDLKPQFRAWGGSYAEAGQLQQRPAPRGGGMFQRDDWEYVDELPRNVTKIVRGWDFASTKGAGAFTAGVKMGMGPPPNYEPTPGEPTPQCLYIIDVRRGQWSSNEVLANLKKTAHADGKGVMVDIPQDPGQSGKFQKGFLVGQLQGYKIFSSPETGSKEDRALPLSGQAEAGNVYLVRGSWNDAFINEASLFPNGEFKDQIDAASRAHARLFTSKRRKKPGVGALIKGA